MRGSAASVGMGQAATIRHREHLPVRQEHPGLDHPRAAHPEQADRWTWLVAAGYTQLRLARSLVDDLRLPLERRRKPGRLTPGSGRHKRTRLEQRTRYPAIKKAA